MGTEGAGRLAHSWREAARAGQWTHGVAPIRLLRAQVTKSLSFGKNFFIFLLRYIYICFIFLIKIVTESKKNPEMAMYRDFSGHYFENQKVIPVLQKSLKPLVHKEFSGHYFKRSKSD